MDTTGGGWTIIQRRGWPLPRGATIRENFHKDWKSYEDGFGDINSDFWLGTTTTKEGNLSHFSSGVNNTVIGNFHRFEVNIHIEQTG